MKFMPPLALVVLLIGVGVGVGRVVAGPSDLRTGVAPIDPSAGSTAAPIMDYAVSASASRNGGALREFEPLTVTFSLQPGWNLISLPLLADVADQEMLESYVFLSCDATSFSYQNGSVMIPGRAYWLFAPAGITLTMPVRPDSLAWSLQPGWNFSGPAKDMFLSAAGAVVWEWRAGRFCELDVIQDSYLLRAGRGYWIFSDAGQSFALDNRYLVFDLSAGPGAASYPAGILATAPAAGWPEEFKTTRLVLRWVPAGSFVMGTPESEDGRRDDEVQHQVTLTRGFYLGVFELTQKQWQLVMDDWPSFFENPLYRDSRPVELVVWDQVRGGDWPGEPPGNGLPAPGSFVQKLRDRTGTACDLPTEAQWEYACRAGTVTALHSGEDLTDLGECPNLAKLGRYYHNGGSGYQSGSSPDNGTAQVGSYLPNAWGLYDLHGNVFEWCLDWRGPYELPGPLTDPAGPAASAMDPAQRVLRGGSWGYQAGLTRSGYRDGDRPGVDSLDMIYSNYGFRVCVPAPAW